MQTANENEYFVNIRHRKPRRECGEDFSGTFFPTNLQRDIVQDDIEIHSMAFCEICPMDIKQLYSVLIFEPIESMDHQPLNCCRSAFGFALCIFFRNYDIKARFRSLTHSKKKVENETFKAYHVFKLNLPKRTRFSNEIFSILNSEENCTNATVVPSSLA